MSEAEGESASASETSKSASEAERREEAVDARRKEEEEEESGASESNGVVDKDEDDNDEAAVTAEEEEGKSAEEEEGKSAEEEEAAESDSSGSSAEGREESEAASAAQPQTEGASTAGSESGEEGGPPETARSSDGPQEDSEGEGEDEESKVAAQMAAVAAAATAATCDSESPSATANLAQSISATITDMPPPPPPPPAKKDGSARKRKKKRHAVHVHLVRHFLMQALVDAAAQARPHADAALAESVEVQLGQAPDVINVNQRVNVSGDGDGDGDGSGHDDGHDDSLADAPPADADAHTDTDTETDAHTDTDTDTDTDTAGKRMDSTDTLDTSDTATLDSHSSIDEYHTHTQQQQQLGHMQQAGMDSANPLLILDQGNEYFLKILIMLSSFTCLPSNTDIDNTATATSNSPHTNADREQHAHAPVDASKGWSDAENKHASDAANKVLALLQKAQNSYHFLHALLPALKAASRHHSGPSADAADAAHLPHDSDGVQSIDFNSDSSYATAADHQSTHLIPDLLPPCTSLHGDATEAFFQACKSKPAADPSSLDKTSQDPHSTSKSNTSTNTNTNDQFAAESNNRSAPSSPKTSVASSIVSSVLSSVKPGGGTGGASGGGTTIGGVISKVRGRRRGIKVNASPTAADAAAHGDTSAKPASPSPSRQEHQQQEPSHLAKQSSHKRSRSGAEYDVIISREMLGLTVENVLERTVVRTVLQNGAAKKAGAKVGSLIVRVGRVETTNLTHFETIDELRQSQRPLKLVLRRISKDALKGAREEMGRLIRGGGFGVATMHVPSGPPPSPSKGKDQPGDPPNNGERTANADEPSSTKFTSTKRQKISLDKDAFMINLHEQWMDGTKRFITLSALTKKDEVLCKAGEKLIWILSLLVIGFEREAAKLNASAEDGWAQTNEATLSDWSTNNSTHHHYSAKDYLDAAKSVSKILHDYVKKHFEKEAKPSFDLNQPDSTLDAKSSSNIRKRNKLLNPPQHIINKQMNAVPGASKRSTQQPGVSSNVVTPCSPAETALLRIGDVLHRTRTFLADPLSKPAALLRGEVIALLCDVLDIDVDMTLSQDESDLPAAGSGSASGGGNGGDDSGGGLTNDLGSAGSLLKLIVLNCSIMSSLSYAENTSPHNQQGDDDTYKKHAGNRFLAVVHRLAASRSTSARVTACSLGPVLWSRLDFPHQLQLRGVITRALHDVEVVVRKSTATVLHEIAELVFDSRAVPWLVLMCERAMTDPEPQLRAAAMTLTWHLAEHLPNAFYGDASEGSRFLRGLPPRDDPTFTEVYLLQCKLLPVATRLAEDREASVRLAVAAQCDRLVNALGKHWYSVIIDLLQALLGDTDDRVRSEATLCMPRLVEIVLVNTANNGAGTNMSVTVLESLLPVASKLLKDKSTDVRVSLAAASGELLTLLVGLPILEDISGGNDSHNQLDSEHSDRTAKGHKKHIDDALIPLLQTLLHDAQPEVTSAALRAVTNASRGNGRDINGAGIRNLGREDDSISMSSHQSHTMDPVFTPVLSEKQVLRLLPTLTNLANSSQWRVRQSAVEIVPALLGCTHRLETRSEIAQLCVTLMEDTVYSVRKTAAECLCIGGSSVGDRGTNRIREWITAIVIPHIEACQNSRSYKKRLLSLKMVEIVLATLASSVTVGGKPTETINTVSTPSPSTVSASLMDNTNSTNPSRKMLQIAASLSDDTIANIRLNVGRVYGNIINFLEEEDITYVVTVLQDQLRNEFIRPEGPDRDVLFYAKNAIRLAKDRLSDATGCE